MGDSRRKILIADADPQTYKLIKILMEPIADVLVAKTGRDAIRFMACDSFDAIVADTSMPDMDGRDMYEKLSELNKCIRRECLSGRFLFFSTNDSSEYMSYVNDRKLHYMQKPASLSEVYELIEKISR